MVAFLFLLTVSLSQRSLFQHVKLCVTFFLSMKSATRILLQTQIYANLVERNSILTLSYRATRSWSLFKVQLKLCFTKCCFLLDAVREKYGYVCYATLHFICRIVEFNKNYMKCTKFGILVNKTTSLFTSIRYSKIPGGVRKFWKFRRGGGGVNFWGRFWKIQRGGGVIRQIPSVGGLWIFSGTTHCHDHVLTVV